MLNKHSGLFGVSGVSNDMLELEKAEAQGNERARLAIDMFCYRVRKYIGAYAAAMGGVDAIVFTGGIGENSSIVRARTMAGLEFMGAAIDPARNDAAVRGEEADISTTDAKVRTLVIPTNEELIIARDTLRLVEGKSRPAAEPAAAGDTRGRARARPLGRARGAVHAPSGVLGPSLAPDADGRRDGRERLLQVGDQVLDVLDADRVAHQAVGDAGLQPVGAAHAGVGHRGGVLDEALDAAQRDGQRRHLHVVHHGAAGLDARPSARS